jgi:hypothetical protein
MKIEHMLSKNKSAVAVVALVLIVLSPIAYYGIRDAFFPSANPFLEKPDPKYKECVRDTLYMRFHHMDLLKEIRVQVVREGIRSDLSLEQCRECHTNRGRFCNQCHNDVNLNLDCFGCHNYPESPRETIMALSSRSGTNATTDLSKPGQ